MEKLRTALVLIGWIVAYGGNLFLDYPANLITIVIGIGMSIYGCYLWTKLKNRHWVFSLWGIITPVGLLGVSLLKDKTPLPG